MKYLEPSERLRRANEIVTEFDTVLGLAADVALISNGRFEDVFSSSRKDLVDKVQEMREVLEEINRISSDF